MANTFEVVVDLIAKQLNISPEMITEDKDVVKDLGADSLDVVEMIITLEEQFNISVSNEDTQNIKTVGDIVNIIEKK